MEVSRKLAAVFTADVAGYSRLTEQDEVASHRRVVAKLDIAAGLVADAARNRVIMDGLKRHGLLETAAS